MPFLCHHSMLPSSLRQTELHHFRRIDSSTRRRKESEQVGSVLIECLTIEEVVPAIPRLFLISE